MFEVTIRRMVWAICLGGLMCSTALAATEIKCKIKGVGERNYKLEGFFNKKVYEHFRLRSGVTFDDSQWKGLKQCWDGIAASWYLALSLTMTAGFAMLILPGMPDDFDTDHIPKLVAKYIYVSCVLLSITFSVTGVRRCATYTEMIACLPLSLCGLYTN